MSATSAPFGFRPTFHNSGQMRPKAYTIASGYAVNIFSGDPVKLTDAGTIQLGTSDGTRAGTFPDVALLGIFAGCEYLDASGKPVVSPYWPTGTTATNIVAWVFDDPETLFAVEYPNPSPGTTVQTAVGETMDWAQSASPYGSTYSGLSSAYLGVIDVAGNPGVFQLVGFSGNVNDSLTDAYVVATVRINVHHYKASTAGV